MKAKNQSGVILAAIVCGLAFSSCRKEAVDSPSKNNMTIAAGTLEGTKLTGSIAVVTEDDESAIIFNNADKLVIIGIPKTKRLYTGTIELAELIVSKYGAVVKDVSNNEVWLLPNDDEESSRKFEHVRASLPGANYKTTISGFIEINTGKE